MIYEKISLNHGSTINTGEFQSKRVDLEVVVRLEEGESYDHVYESLKKDLQSKVANWEQEIRVNLNGVKEPKVNSTNSHTIAQKSVSLEPETIKCPKCGEQMLPKDGKDYYTCSKHWGYPDMIQKGEVRDKKY